MGGIEKAAVQVGKVHQTYAVTGRSLYGETEQVMTSCRLSPILNTLAIPQLRHKGADYPLTFSLAVSYLPNVFMREPHAPGYNRDHSSDERGLSELYAYPCKIHGGYQLSESEHYAEPRMEVNHKTRLRVNAEDRPAISAEMRGARARLGLSQTALAKLLGSSQGAITRWERGKDSPPISALLAMADVVEDGQRAFWLEAAGVPRIVFEDGREICLTNSDEQNLLRGPAPLGVFSRRHPETRIGVLKNPFALGAEEALNTANLEVSLSFPSAWFPKDSDIQAARMTGLRLPFIEGDMIALVDISRTDPDRLLGCTVAVRTPEGVEPRVLKKDGSTYLLVPIQPDDKHQVKIFRRNGDWAIVGRILKWIADPPPGRAV